MNTRSRFGVIGGSPARVRRKYPRWMHLILSAFIVAGVGIGQGTAAPNNPNQPNAVKTKPAVTKAKPAKAKPILTKSSKRAARQAAAAAAAGQTATLQAAPAAVTGQRAVVPTAPATLAAVLAAPVSPTDQTKVPHYFGPFPNWANSPFTLPDAVVTIAPPPNAQDTTATATATVGAKGEVTGITVTNPGSGYASAPAVTVTGGGANATATAVVTLNGSVTAITVGAPGAGYTAPQVTITGGGATGTTSTVGNPLVARTYATDFATSPGTLGPVLVVPMLTMPASGMVQSIEYFNQATTGSSPTPSAGNLFHAYVLQATGVANEYTVLWDSGELIVPATPDPIGEVVTISVPNVAVTTGDTIAFYGEGIPVDIVATGTDVLSFPATTAPVQGNTITLGDATTFPIFPQARTYSVQATVLDTSNVPPLTNATATAYGGVDAVNVIDGGNGYTNPTVEFDLPDSPDGVQAVGHAVCTFTDINGNCEPTGSPIAAVVIDQPGSGYSFAPALVIRDGTLFDPLLGGIGATATATLSIQTVTLNTFGSGYVSAPTVTITDPTGTGATASAVTDFGTVTRINVTNPGSGYVTKGGIKKFVDTLPGLCIPAPGTTFAACADNNLGQHIPVAVADTTSFAGNAATPAADYYEIALVQYRKRMSSSLPAPGTLLRGYVQLETPANASVSKHVQLFNESLDPTQLPTPVLRNNQPVYAVDDPQYLGPVIVATKNRPVRITFYNLLPTGSGGDLIIPTDSTLMGSGFLPSAWHELADAATVLDEARNPPCTQYPKSDACFKDNRATLHLHGGLNPWISDGTPHQWITPAGETTTYPEGASVGNVPDMVGVANVPDCSAENDGCQTFYYTNQQSARLMFYHDHAFGTTRLNVYLGEAAGYLIADPTEQRLINAGTIPADQIPLVIQDRTFVPSPQQVAEQDPTWDYTRWGGYGDFWYHHVYMPAQNPGDPSGMSAYGRWMFGPFFWPPATPPHGPIDNPYYDANCNLDDPATWQYQTDPFCEPATIPGTPNISAGMEQFNDTPLVNGTAYPTVTLEPKAYRLRVLNAANDRFMNLSLYEPDPSTASTDLNAKGEVIGGTEVAFKQAELDAAQLDPVVFPTPDTTISKPGPSWIQIGTEGGFLPAPAVIPPHETTWITDPTRFDVGNVDQHSLLIAPAERADVIVDFSAYAGKTLILYNDAPAAFPARVPSYDYYTGAPDLSPVGAPAILPGYGPNTRTVMQIKVANTAPAAAFNLTALRNAFKHNLTGTGVFESGQHPIVVGQAAYNSAYGTSFAASSNCNNPGSTVTRCDGLLRINNQGGDLFGFNTLRAPNAKMQILIEPKGIHDEMNSASFDEFGRMSANMGLEAVPATPGLQNITLYPYVNPPTELIDGTRLPSAANVTPIASASDGTQIWKITHNGVDTHPIHFHLYDVQLLNRVTWDNIIIPPDPNELGWKDTVRVSPLEDTIVAVRAVVPVLPFDLPNSIRLLNPALPEGSDIGFNNMDASGNPTSPITNTLVNFGWEYVWHCHILSHEEMDMMRPQSLVLPPRTPTGLTAAKNGSGAAATVTLTWNDNSLAETQTLVQVASSATGPWTDVDTILAPPDVPNVTGQATYLHNAGIDADVNFYRVVAQNTAGYGGQFMSLTAQAASGTAQIPAAPAAGVAPTSLDFGSLVVGNSAVQTVTVSNTGRLALSISSVQAPAPFAVTNGCPASLAAASTCQISVTFAPTAAGTFTGALTIATNDPVNPTLTVALTGAAVTALPAAPTNLTGSAVRLPLGAPGRGNNDQVTLNWVDNANNENAFVIQRAEVNANNCNGAVFANTATVGANVTTFTQLAPRAGNLCYRVRARNGAGVSAFSNVLFLATP